MPRIVPARRKPPAMHLSMHPAIFVGRRRKRITGRNSLTSESCQRVNKQFGLPKAVHRRMNQRHLAVLESRESRDSKNGDCQIPSLNKVGKKNMPKHGVVGFDRREVVFDSDFRANLCVLRVSLISLNAELAEHCTYRDSWTPTKTRRRRTRDMRG